ncbi:unnamed protein product [Microthlaspi erraticum]|uniref:Uncharacterized protein n=1 Tax=Microthlaspi erraticum TaxID=1685480 RepID=A0A6D2LCI4_9BRAS|nr:unnamed protein product [Microthlaspi erraticum]CAA7057414.1 unnamed protein product [Microthlaspi erraticum]
MCLSSPTTENTEELQNETQTSFSFTETSIFSSTDVSVFSSTNCAPVILTSTTEIYCTRFRLFVGSTVRPNPFFMGDALFLLHERVDRTESSSSH